MLQRVLELFQLAVCSRLPSHKYVLMNFSIKDHDGILRPILRQYRIYDSDDRNRLLLLIEIIINRLHILGIEYDTLTLANLSITFEIYNNSPQNIKTFQPISNFSSANIFNPLLSTPRKQQVLKGHNLVVKNATKINNPFNTERGRRAFSTSTLKPAPGILMKLLSTLNPKDQPESHLLPGKWHNYQIPVNKVLSTVLLKYVLNKFRRVILKKLGRKQVVLILLKLRDSSNNFKTLAGVKEVSLKNFDSIIYSHLSALDLKINEYHSLDVTHIYVKYFIVPENELAKTSLHQPNARFNPKKPIAVTSTSKFFGYDLPKTMDFEQWGFFTWITDTKVEVTTKTKSGYDIKYLIEIFDKHTNVRCLTRHNVLILDFTDKMLDPGNLGTFTRTLKTHEYHFINGELIYKSHKIKPKYLQNLQPALNQITEFITLDFETRLINNIMSPFAVSWYDGKDVYSYYLNDFNDSNEMITQAFKDLVCKANHNRRVYIHNSSNFDIVLFINVLKRIGKIKSINKRDQQFIDIVFGIGDHQVYLRDSLSILQASLRRLAKAFNVEAKGYFPYNFVNQDVPLDYIGAVPDFKYFEDFSVDDFNQYSSQFNNNWNLKLETITYCNLDCIVLYQVLGYFSNLIFKH